MNVCILFSVFCVLRHVSDQYSTTALTFEWNILSLVLILICITLQVFLNMLNATLAFCILALTSSYVPPFVMIVLPRYVNESVSSSGSSFNVMWLLLCVLAFIIVVLLLLMLNPSCVDTVFSNSVFFLHLLMTVVEEREVQDLQLAPRCPLDPISSVFCSIFHE